MDLAAAWAQKTGIGPATSSSLVVLPRQECLVPFPHMTAGFAHQLAEIREAVLRLMTCVELPSISF